jgi:hypothetical protein
MTTFIIKHFQDQNLKKYKLLFKVVTKMNFAELSYIYKN